MGQEEASASKKILCFGDSLTEGWYKTGFSFHPYTIRLSQLFEMQQEGSRTRRVELLNKGISGEVVNPEMLERLPVVLDNKGPFDFAIILGGTNDLAFLKAAKENNLSKNIISLHQIAHSKGVKTCLITIPQTGFDILPYSVEYVQYREQVNDELREFVSRNSSQVCLCDLSVKLPMYGGNENEFVEYWDDELHFTPKGYSRMAEIIFEDIKDFI